MRSRAGFFWCSLWLTLLLLLPLILVVGFLARQRQTQQELRQAAANQSQLQIEPGAQSVWRMLLVVQKEEPAFVLVRADGPAHSVTFCALPGQLLVNAPAGTTTLAECTLSAGAGGCSTAEGCAFHRRDRPTAAVLPGGHALLLGGLRGQRHGGAV